MIREERIRQNFIDLARFDSETFHERKIGEYLVKMLRDLGLEVRTDTTDEAYLKKHPDSFPNIYGVLKGTDDREPILFSAHLDTVAPGNGKQVNCSENGILTSEGKTVLGADDISGIVSILEALAVIREEKCGHREIEVLFSPAEEAFCEGTRYLDRSLIRSETAYVLDLDGAVGTAAFAAPTVISFEIEIIGKASHAGFAPEEGINALTIAAEALREIRAGRIDPETTVNFGTISGGTGKNIVPERVRIGGEVRSGDHAAAAAAAGRILDCFRVKAGKAGGTAVGACTEHIRAFALEETEMVVQRFLHAAKAEKLDAKLIKTFGGSDGSRFNEAGIRSLVLACAMEKVHTTGESAKVSELKKAAELVLRLMTMK